MYFNYNVTFKRQISGHNEFSKIPASTLVHLATRVRKSRVFVCYDLDVFLCSQLHPKCQPAIRLAYPPFLCKLRISSKSTKKQQTYLAMQIQTAVSGNNSELDTSHISFFFSRDDRYYLPS